MIRIVLQSHCRPRCRFGIAAQEKMRCVQTARVVSMNEILMKPEILPTHTAALFEAAVERAVELLLRGQIVA